MKIQDLPSLRTLIREKNLKTKKRLGQNFLLDSNITDKIARSSGPLKGRTLIEVGPGPGGLTRSLLLAGADHVIAIEKDLECIELLSSLVEAAQGRLTLLHQDALTTPYQDLIGPKTKIIANLPYNIGTALLIKWLPLASSLENLTLMFQKEVALRLVASPGTKDYGRLSLLTQWYTQAYRSFDVSPDAFTPPPKVFSSVVVLTPHRYPPYPACSTTLEKVIKQAFSHRRKTLRRSLRGLTDTPEKLLEDAGISPCTRPEELSLESFCHLSKLLEKDLLPK